MRKLFNFFVAALVMLTAASCEKSEVLPDSTEGKVVTLSATINNGGTKTSLGGEKGSDGKYPVLWSAGDAIAVIQGDVVYKFNLNSVDNTGQSGTFALDNTLNYQREFDEDREIKAFYPYSGVSLENGEIKYNVPATQIYAENSFGNGVSPMAAHAGNAAAGLSFENLFGVLKLQLKGAENEKVFGIEIISDNSLKGNAQLTIDDASNSISLTGTESSDKKVILKCEEGVSLSPGTSTDFLVALPANATNLRVLIHTIKGSYYKEVPSQNANSNPINAITAGQILKMHELILGTNIAPIIYMENGESLGNGIAIPTSDGTFTIWAPVNCGYHATNFKYGKLYQWGRKYGQGYWQSESFENNDSGGGPVIQEYPIGWGNYIANADIYSNVFFKVTRDNTSDWLSAPRSDLWGNGTKTIHDPCPDGWRVPTIAELEALALNNSVVYNKGSWFSGKNTCNDKYPRIFLQFAGYHNFESEVGGSREGSGSPTGYYWSSTADGDYSKPFAFMKNGSGLFITRSRTARASGHSVRCVKDMTQSQPMPGSN